MELDPGTWAVHRCVVDAPFGSWCDGPDRRVRRVPRTHRASASSLEHEDQSESALTDEFTSAG